MNIKTQPSLLCCVRRARRGSLVRWRGRQRTSEELGLAPRVPLGRGYLVLDVTQDSLGDLIQSLGTIQQDWWGKKKREEVREHVWKQLSKLCFHTWVVLFIVIPSRLSADGISSAVAYPPAWTQWCVRWHKVFRKHTVSRAAEGLLSSAWNV